MKILKVDAFRIFTLLFCVFSSLITNITKEYCNFRHHHKFGGYKEKEVKEVPGFTALPLRYQVFPRFVNFGFAMFLYPLVFEIYIH